MGQINLYRIDNKKRDEFLDNLYKKFEFLGEQSYSYGIENKEECVVMTYANKAQSRKVPEWKWVLDEYDYEIPEGSIAVRAVLVIEIKEITYAVTYGMAFLQ